MLLSCKQGKHAGRVNPETVVTMRSDDLSMTVSRDGLKSYHFTTPSMEQYDLASDPYTKYPEGIYVETFQDSTEIVESTLRADEAIYYQNRKMWMASGNVVATGSGNTLYTEQLFWDEKTDRVFSNVRVRVVDQDGEHLGEGFESDVNFETWVMRDYEGTLVLDTTPNEEGGEESGDGMDEGNTTPKGVQEGAASENGHAPAAERSDLQSSGFGEVRRHDESAPSNRTVNGSEVNSPSFSRGQTNTAQ